MAANSLETSVVPEQPAEIRTILVGSNLNQFSDKWDELHGVTGEIWFIKGDCTLAKKIAKKMPNRSKFSKKIEQH